MNKTPGLGDTNACFTVYTRHRPPLVVYEQLTSLQPLRQGEVKQIADNTSNHWRKVFNVYAKLLFSIDKTGYTSWQQLRDEILLQASSGQALHFLDSHHCDFATEPAGVHILMGKTFALDLLTEQQLNQYVWIESDIAINRQDNIIISPYFDYRQLNNAKIDVIARLVQGLVR
ncbi:DUF6942 family protein [Thalassotalea maritima]|uniref:DUF6942 family protein n=1 Tax=Thalassotalea maritima TaxID=3242416 RepID=UPI003527B49F